MKDEVLRIQRERLSIRREELRRQYEALERQKEEIESQQRDIEIKITANINEAQDIADKLLGMEQETLIDNNI